MPRFSATAYFFAAALHRELKVPIGIIKSAWGGKPVQTFISREALTSIPEGRADLDLLDKAMAGYDPKDGWSSPRNPNTDEGEAATAVGVVKQWMAAPMSPSIRSSFDQFLEGLRTEGPRSHDDEHIGEQSIGYRPGHEDG